MNTDERDDGQGLSRRATLGREFGGAAAALLAACASSGRSPAIASARGM